MTSGREGLHRIDAAIAQAREKLVRISATASGDMRALTDIDRRQIELLESVAGHRLAHLKDGAGNGGALGEADRQAQKLLTEHDEYLATLTARRTAAEIEVTRLETARRFLEQELAAALERHDAAAAATHARLEKDVAYASRAAALEAANARAEKAAGKLELAREDRLTKGAAYEADPLFVYLRDRNFGERSYRALPPFAVLDGWVAGLIDYRDHKLNYARLTEIPERLAEHVERMRNEADSLATALETLEREALEADGVGALRAAAEEARRRLDANDASLEEAEREHGRLASEIAGVANGAAGPLGDARTLLAQAMQRMTVPDLKVLAAETATLDDDRLVDQLVRLRRERLEFEEEQKSAAAALDREARTLSELEDLRRRYKGARFDSPYSEFSGGDLIGVLLSELMRGALSRDDFWRRIERAHRTRRRDWENDMGGDAWRGGFGLPDGWGAPPGRSSGSDHGRSGKASSDWGRRSPTRVPRAPRPPSRPPAPPRRGGGGFHTGGGF